LLGALNGGAVVEELEGGAYGIVTSEMELLISGLEALVA